MTEKISIPFGITNELAEETGWHIGDGSMNYYKNQVLHINIPTSPLKR